MSSFSDPIAELLTKIRNAKNAKHRFVDVSLSKMKLEIIQIMKQYGFIENFLVGEEKRKVRIFLKYAQARKSVIKDLKRISTPGLRRYVGYADLLPVFGGMGISIISTSHGVMDGAAAKRKKLGGEWLCNIW